MRRVQASSGKASSKMIVAVSSAMTMVPFWKQKLDEYISTAPAMHAFGGRVLDHLQTLRALQPELSSIGPFKAIMKDLPELTSRLRAGVTTELAELALDFLHKLWPQFAEKAKTDLQASNVGEMVEVISTCSDVYSLDSDVQQMLQQCGQWVQQCGHDKLVHEFAGTMNAVLKASKGSKEGFQDSLLQFVNAAGALSIPAEALKKKKEVWDQTFELVNILFASAQYVDSKTEEGANKMNMFARCGEVLVAKTQDDAMRANMTALSSLAKVADAMIELERQDTGATSRRL